MEEKKVNKDLLRLENKYINGGVYEDIDGALDHRAMKIKSLFSNEEKIKKEKPKFFKIKKPKSNFRRLKKNSFGQFENVLDCF